MIVNCNYCNIEVERKNYNDGRVSCFDCKKKRLKENAEKRKLKANKTKQDNEV